MSPRRREPGLTKQQRAILDAIHFFLAKGEIPTVREVGALMRLRSPATVWKHLEALQAKRLISMNGKSRGIRLTAEAWNVLHPGTVGEMPAGEMPAGGMPAGGMAGSQAPPESDPRGFPGREVPAEGGPTTTAAGPGRAVAPGAQSHGSTLPDGAERQTANPSGPEPAGSQPTGSQRYRTRRGISAVTWDDIFRAARMAQALRAASKSRRSGRSRKAGPQATIPEAQGAVPPAGPPAGPSASPSASPSAGPSASPSASPSRTVSGSPFGSSFGSSVGRPGGGPGRTVPIVGAIAAGRPFESYSDGFFRGSGSFAWSGAGPVGDSSGSRSSGSRDSGRDAPRAWGSAEGSSRHAPRGDLEPRGGLEHRRAAEREAILRDGLGDGILEHGMPGDGLGAPRVEDLSGASELGGLTAMDLPIDPALFVESGEVFALRVEGDSMVNAGILDGDFVIIRRQNTVEEGEIAAVLIDGEGTLKRWHVRHRDREGSGRDRVDVDDVRDATGDAARGETTGARDRAGPGRAQADLHGIREETDSEEGLGLVAPGGRGPRSPVERPSARCVRLDPANERFEPIYIDEDDCRDVLVFGKYVGLVRGNLRFA